MSAPSTKQTEQCSTFGQFVQTVSKMTNNSESVPFEGIVRSRRDACVFILEQRDTYAPPALSSSALARIWTQLGCSIDVSRTVDPAVAKKKATNAASPQVGDAPSAARKGGERRAVKNGALPSASLVLVLDSNVTSIEWATVTVCGKKINAGGCYMNALTLDSKCNAAAWFNLGCWLSTETKEVVKGNARALAMVKAEEDEERHRASHRQRSSAAPRRSVSQYGIPKGAVPPGGRPPLQAAAKAESSLVDVNNKTVQQASSFITLPFASIDRRDCTAAVCFANAVAADAFLQGGWLNLGAALALEQLLEKKGAIPPSRHPLTIEEIATIRATNTRGGNPNTGYNPTQMVGGKGAHITIINRNGASNASDQAAPAPSGGTRVTRQYCYIKELEASLIGVPPVSNTSGSPDSPQPTEGSDTPMVPMATISAALTSFSATSPPQFSSSFSFAKTADGNLIGPSSLSSPNYLNNHPEAITSVTFTDSAPSSDGEDEKTKKLRHERRVSRYRALAITADARGPSKETVRALAWINLAATIESSKETVVVRVRNFYVPSSYPEIGDTFISSDAKPVRLLMSKRHCLESAIVEDATIAKAWLNLGATMDDNEVVTIPLGVSKDKQRVNRLHCFVKAIEVSNDANPTLWMTIGASLFDDLKASNKLKREQCARLPLKSRRKITGNSGNVTVHTQRANILEERKRDQMARAAAAELASQQGPSSPLTKAQLDQLNQQNPNTKLSQRKHANLFEDEDDDSPPAVVGETFDCVDCMEEYLCRCPDDSKGWMQAARMFQYFTEQSEKEESGAVGSPIDNETEELKEKGFVGEETATEATVASASTAHETSPIPLAMVVAGFRYTTPREVFSEVVRIDPDNGEVWCTLGNYLYYDPANADGTMTVRIGRSRRGELMTYKDCYNKAQSLGAMSRYACCSVM